LHPRFAFGTPKLGALVVASPVKLIDNISRLQNNGLSCRQTAAYLNEEVATYWTWGRFCPALVFGVRRKVGLKRERIADFESSPEIKVAIEQIN